MRTNMRKHVYFAMLLSLGIFTLCGCSLSFGQPQGPDSGDEIELGPDSGDEIDMSDEPKSPDSGDEIDMSQPSEDEEEADDEDEDEGEEPTGPDSGDEIDTRTGSPDSGEDYTVKGSCNRIGDGSTCVEYVGSFWTKTQARLNCSSDEAFSTSPCPRPVIGGCRIGAGSATEVITWHYGYGGDPYTEAAPYAAQACKSLPGGAWVQ